MSFKLLGRSLATALVLFAGLVAPAAEVRIFENVSQAGLLAPVTNGSILGVEHYATTAVGDSAPLRRFEFAGGIQDDQNPGTQLSQTLFVQFYDLQANLVTGFAVALVAEGNFIYIVHLPFDLSIPTEGFMELSVADQAVSTIWLANSAQPTIGSSPLNPWGLPPSTNFFFALGVESVGICRGADLWGDYAGGDGGFDYTQAAIDAAGCLEVCGQWICGTDGWDVADSMGSANEALCRRSDRLFDGRRLDLDNLYRELTAASLNCTLSGLGPDSCGALINPSLDGITWEQCNDTCLLGDDADSFLAARCRDQLACWNNGTTWTGGPDGACDETMVHECRAGGFCSSPIAARFANGYLVCPPSSVPEDLGPARGAAACEDAGRSRCSMRKQRWCNPNTCAGSCAPPCLHLPTLPGLATSPRSTPVGEWVDGDDSQSESAGELPVVEVEAAILE